jgi:hypothetical protein
MCRKSLLLKFAIVFSAGVCFGTTQGIAEAAVMTINTTAPTVDGADIALLPGATTTTEGNFAENLVFHDVAYHGQTFTTGSNPTGYTMSGMSALHFQADIVGGSSWSVPAFRLSIGTIDGLNVYTPLVTEDIPDANTGTVTENTNEWIHLTLGSALNLNPNTEYAFVLGIPSGILGFRWSQSTVNTDYLGGNAFSDTSPPHLTLDNPMIERNFDRIFHVDLEANEFTAVPEPSTYAMGLIGLVGLGLSAWRMRRGTKCL